MTQAYNLSQLANNLNSSGQLDATDGLVNAVPVTNGGTGASTATAARSNLSAAKSGANSDITSITGLTTALSVPQGGTGTTSLSGVAYGNGTGAFTAASAAQLAAALGSAYGVTSVNGTAGAVTLSGLSDFNRSLTTPGYQKLPGGLMIQWGRQNIPVSGAPLFVPFGFTFPTACFCVLWSQEYGTGFGELNKDDYLLNFSTTGFNMNQPNYATNFYINFIALGN